MTTEEECSTGNSVVSGCGSIRNRILANEPQADTRRCVRLAPGLYPRQLRWGARNMAPGPGPEPPRAGAPAPVNVEPRPEGSGSTFAIFDPEVPGPEHGPLARSQVRAATPKAEGH